MAEQKNDETALNTCPEWLSDLLSELRSTNQYGNKLKELILNLGLPEDAFWARAEALIISAADNLDNSLERDAALAALGLVRGCSRLEQPKRLTARGAVSWRRIQFLLKSSYLQDEDEYRQCEAALQAIISKKNHGIKKILDDLGGNDKSYIDKIATIIDSWDILGELKEQSELALKNIRPITMVHVLT